MAYPFLEDWSDQNAVSPDERRDIAHVLAYWEELCGERKYPFEEDVDPARLEAIWPFVFIARIDSGVRDAVFTYGGEEIATFCGCQTSGMKVADCFAPMVWERMRPLFDSVSDHGQPLGASDDCTLRDGRGLVYRSVVVPLGDQGDALKSLLGVIKFKFTSA